MFAKRQQERLHAQAWRSPSTHLSIRVRFLCSTLLFCLGLSSCGSPAEPDAASKQDVLVAVATNFAPTLEALKTEFESTSSFRLEMATGSSGKLYAQIIAGAPYDVFLSADSLRPQKLAQQGLAAEPFTYAVGQLVLWSVSATLPPPGDSDGELASLLLDYQLSRIAMPNPALAPYGRAALEVLDSLNLGAKLQSRLVFGENVGQAHAMVATGNADIGFSAAAYFQAISPDSARVWPVSADLHEPVVQQGVLLGRSRTNPAALAFIEFLGARPALRILDASGYRTQ